MRLMSPMDSIWLLLESPDTPMHFGTLMIFSPPAGSPGDFVETLVGRMRSARDVRAPWNQQLASGPFGQRLPALREDPHIDVDHHFRYLAVPPPGGRRELMDVVCRLHSRPLDFDRPLWECHLIGGLEDDRFAIYTKIHHGLLDGGSASRLLFGMLSRSPRTRNMVPMWAIAPPEQSNNAPNDQLRTQRPSRFRASVQSLGSLLAGSLAVPYTDPPNILREGLTAPRDISFREFDLAQFKYVAKLADCTVNDLVLYVCSSALRRFLEERSCLPDRPLTVAVPVNLRSAGDERLGNALAQLYVNLATNVADPIDRLQAIKRSVAAAKTQLEAVPERARMLQTLAVTAPYMLGMVAGLGGHAPAPYSLNISNVPGPPAPLYFNGARMESLVPLSFLMHGGALIVICTSYAGKLVLAITAAREQLPEFDDIGDHLDDAFEEISRLFTETETAR
ncbi:MAG: diacylglycerol O-acyltransferase / wax synthase [Mycobacterium sp.]|nr:diacylglycerol O-acyltransferase / wax synthase [Mycobacterium sp.]